MSHRQHHTDNPAFGRNKQYPTEQQLKLHFVMAILSAIKLAAATFTVILVTTFLVNLAASAPTSSISATANPQSSTAVDHDLQPNVVKRTTPNFDEECKRTYYQNPGQHGMLRRLPNNKCCICIGEDSICECEKLCGLTTLLNRFELPSGCCDCKNN